MEAANVGDRKETMVQQRIPAHSPDVLNSLAITATAPETAVSKRLKVVELLFRFAAGPTDHQPGSDDILLVRQAQEVLLRTAPLIAEIAKSHLSSRVRTRAHKLAERISKIRT